MIAIDKDETLVDKLKDRVTHAVSLDVTDERSLRSVNISDVDTAVVAIGDHIDMSIMAVTMLRKLGVGRVIARATSVLHEYVLSEIGASEIIKVEEEMGEIIASKIVAPHVLERYNFAAGYSLVEIKLGKKFEGKTVKESRMQEDYHLNVIALQKKVPYIDEDGRSSFRVEINDNPSLTDVIEGDDIVVLVGSEKNLNRLFEDLEEN